MLDSNSHLINFSKQPETREWDCAEFQNKVIEELESADGKSLAKVKDCHIMLAKCSSATLYEVLDRFGRQDTEDSGFTSFTLIRIEGLDAEINDTALEGLISKC